MEIVIYDKTRNCYTDGKIGDWVVRNNIDHVVEIHMNAATNTSARGFEIIKHTNNKLETQMDKKLKDYFSNYFKIRETKNLNLYNIKETMNLCTYSYLELGFVTNLEDVATFEKNRKKIGEELFQIFQDFDIKNLGVVYGHGAKDPGAVSNNKTERDLVRTLEIKEKEQEVSEWAKKGQEFVVKNKISDGTRPKDTVTREEVWTMLERFKGV